MFSFQVSQSSVNQIFYIIIWNSIYFQQFFVMNEILCSFPNSDSFQFNYWEAEFSWRGVPVRDHPRLRHPSAFRWGTSRRRWFSRSRRSSRSRGRGREGGPFWRCPRSWPRSSVRTQTIRNCLFRTRRWLRREAFRVGIPLRCGSRVPEKKNLFHFLFNQEILFVIQKFCFWSGGWTWYKGDWLNSVNDEDWAQTESRDEISMDFEETFVLDLKVFRILFFHLVFNSISRLLIS